MILQTTPGSFCRCPGVVVFIYVFGALRRMESGTMEVALALAAVVMRMPWSASRARVWLYFAVSPDFIAAMRIAIRVGGSAGLVSVMGVEPPGGAAKAGRRLERDADGIWGRRGR